MIEWTPLTFHSTFHWLLIWMNSAVWPVVDFSDPLHWSSNRIDCADVSGTTLWSSTEHAPKCITRKTTIDILLPEFHREILSNLVRVQTLEPLLKQLHRKPPESELGSRKSLQFGLHQKPSRLMSGKIPAFIWGFRERQHILVSNSTAPGASLAGFKSHWGALRTWPCCTDLSMPQCLVLRGSKVNMVSVML